VTGASIGAQMFLLNSLEVGGSESKIVAVSNALYQRGLPVHLAYLNPPETLLERLHPDLPRLALQRSGKFDSGVVRRLREYVRRQGVSTIHCINRYPIVYGRLAAPRHPEGGLGLTAFLNSTDLPSTAEQAKMLVYAPLLRSARRVIFGCRQQSAMWARRYRLNADRCGYIYNGVRAERFRPEALSDEQRRLRAELGWREDEVVIGMVGQLRPKKGYPDFIAACAGLRRAGLPVKALIVGDGPERAALERQAKEAGLEDHLIFLGERSDVRPALYAMDVFALTSVKSETFSNAALEAMAMQRPVVLLRLGGAAEMVAEGCSGFLYPVGDVARLMQILRRLVEKPALRRDVGRAARKRVLEHFEFERMVDAYEAVMRNGDEAAAVASRQASLIGSKAQGV